MVYGLSAKHYFSPNDAMIVNLGLRWGLSVDTGYVRTLTTLWNAPNVGQLDLSAGAAAMFWNYSYSGYSSSLFGVRGILEFSYKFAAIPLELSVEWGPTLFSSSDIFFQYNGLYLGGAGGGFRWFI